MHDERGAEREYGFAHRLRSAHLAVPRRIADFAEAAGDPRSRKIRRSLTVAEFHEQRRKRRETPTVVHRTISEIMLIDVIVTDYDARVSTQQSEDHLMVFCIVSYVVNEKIEQLEYAAKAVGVLHAYGSSKGLVKHRVIGVEEGDVDCFAIDRCRQLARDGMRERPYSRRRCQG